MARYRVSTTNGSIILTSVSTRQRVTIRKNDLRGRKELLKYIVRKLDDSNAINNLRTNNNYYNMANKLLGNTTRIININRGIISPPSRNSIENATESLRNNIRNSERNIEIGRNVIRNLPVNRRNNTFNQFFLPREGENTTWYWNNRSREISRRIREDEIQRQRLINELRRLIENELRKIQSMKRHHQGPPAA